MDDQKLTSLIDSGKYDGALQQINQVLTRSDLSELEQRQSILTKSKILRLRGSLTDANALLLNLLQTSSEIPLLHFSALTESAYTLFGLHKFAECRDQIKLAEQLWNQLTGSEQELSGQAYATLLHVKGILTLKTGKISEGLTSLEASRAIRHDLNLLHDLAYSYFNIGIIHSIRGQLAKALQLYERSYSLQEQLGNIPAMGFTLSHIGSLLIELGHEEEGWVKLEEGLAYSRQGINPISLSESLFQLFSYALRTSRTAQIEQYLEEMQELSEQQDQYIINLRYNLAKAQYLMDQKRISSMARAKELLEAIIHADTPDFEYQIIALNSYCRLLIDEYTLFQNDDILDEINQFLHQLQKISMENNIHSLLIDAKILLSKITIIRGNTHESVEILQEARDLARQYDLAYAEGKIDLEIHLVLNLTEEQLFQSLSTKEKLEHLRISDYLNSLGEIIDKLKSKDFLTD